MTFQSFILNLSIEKERIISGRPPSAKLGLISSSAFFSHYDCRKSAACASCAIGGILPQRLMFAHKEPLLGIYLMPRTDHWQIMLMLIVIGHITNGRLPHFWLLGSLLPKTKNMVSRISLRQFCIGLKLFSFWLEYAIRDYKGNSYVDLYPERSRLFTSRFW